MHRVGKTVVEYVIIEGVAFRRKPFIDFITERLKAHKAYCKLNNIELISQVFKAIDDFEHKIRTMHIINQTDLNMNALFGAGSNLKSIATTWHERM
ncbi:MAG: hypothetical protein ACRC3J_01800 [Culicoidibacterales bacterium]